MTTSRVISATPGSIRIERIQAETFQNWQSLLDLILKSFAYMNGVIDPPSSALRLTPQSLKEKARAEVGFVAYYENELSACAFFRPEPPDFLYIGKLAASPDRQGLGIGRLLLDQAVTEAARLGLPRLRLETRIELTNNHRQFEKWGFVKTAENAHPGFDRTTSIEMQREVNPPAMREPDLTPHSP